MPYHQSAGVFYLKFMGATKEYVLKLSEQSYNQLAFEEKKYLYDLGMAVKQIPTEEEKQDETYKKLKKCSVDAYQAEQEYLFKKRNNIE